MRLFGILTLSFLFALPSIAQDALTADAILKKDGPKLGVRKTNRHHRNDRGESGAHANLCDGKFFPG